MKNNLYIVKTVLAMHIQFLSEVLLVSKGVRSQCNSSLPGSCLPDNSQK